MQQIIDLSEYEQELNLLERLQHETEARKEICAYLVDTHQNHSEAYQEYFEEFIQYRMAFEMEKDRFIKEEVKRLVDEPILNWRINFYDKEIEVEV